MRAIVLCGGDGRRMRPFSATWEKCLLPIGNESNIKRIVKQLTKLQIEDIVVVTDKSDKNLRRALIDHPQVAYQGIIDQSLSGTILFLSEQKEEVLIYYGDVFAEDDDVHQLLSNGGSNRLLVQEQNNEFNSSEHICVLMDHDIIQAVYAHPREHYVNARSCGVYRVNHEVLKYLQYYEHGFTVLNTGAMPNNDFIFEECINMAIENQAMIRGVKISGLSADLNYPWDLFEINRKFCQKFVGGIRESVISGSAVISEQAAVSGNIVIGQNSFIGKNVVIEGNCRVGDNVVIDNGVVLEKNCIIGDNTNIRNYAKISSGTVIGPDNKIGFAAELSGVTFQGVAAIHNCEVFGVIGRYVDIAAGVQMGVLKFDDTKTTQKVNGKRFATHYTNGIFIGDYTRTGISNVFYPGVKIGSRCAIGPGVVVDRDIEANKLIMLQQEWIVKDWGPNKYGW